MNTNIYHQDQGQGHFQVQTNLINILAHVERQVTAQTQQAMWNQQRLYEQQAVVQRKASQDQLEMAVHNERASNYNTHCQYLLEYQAVLNNLKNQMSEGRYKFD